MPKPKVAYFCAAQWPVFTPPLTRGMVFDNSTLNARPRLLLLFAAGRLAQAEPVLPDWVLSGYAEDLVI